MQFLNTASLSQHCKHNFFALTIVVAFFSFLIPGPTYAMGISPPEVNVNTILRGSSQEAYVTLVRSLEEEGNIDFKVEKRGANAKYIAGANELTLPAGDATVQYNFTISPGDLSNGSYQAELVFFRQDKIKQMAVTSEQTNAKADIYQGIVAQINFSVSGEQLLAYEIKSTKISHTELEKPASMSFTLANQGNVAWKPTRIKVTLVNTKDPTSLLEIEVPQEQIKTIQPGKLETIQFLLDLKGIIVGEYRAIVQVYDGEELVKRLITDSFAVFPANTLAQKGELMLVRTNKSEYTVGEKVKLETKFQNTGQVMVSGQLYVEISKGDEVIDFLHGEKIDVDIGKEVVFTQFIEDLKPGIYIATTHVSYGNKKTDNKKMEIIVKDLVIATEQVSIQWWIILTIILFITIVMLLVHRRYKIKKSKSIDQNI